MIESLSNVFQPIHYFGMVAAILSTVCLSRRGFDVVDTHLCYGCKRECNSLSTYGTCNHARCSVQRRQTAVSKQTTQRNQQYYSDVKKQAWRSQHVTSCGLDAISTSRRRQEEAPVRQMCSLELPRITDGKSTAYFDVAFVCNDGWHHPSMMPTAVIHCWPLSRYSRSSHVVA